MIARAGWFSVQAARRSELLDDLGLEHPSGGGKAGVEIGETLEVFRAGRDVGLEAADDVGSLVFRRVEVFQP